MTRRRRRSCGPTGDGTSSTRPAGRCGPGCSGSPPTSVWTCCAAPRAGPCRWTSGRRRRTVRRSARRCPRTGSSSRCPALRCCRRPTPPSSSSSGSPCGSRSSRPCSTCPPRQRATLILREVLHFSATETAALLETSPAAVNSALQRARETLARHRPSPAEPYDPADAAQRALLDRYVAAFEAHDVRALTDVLRDDATTSMPPFGWWVQGGARIAALVATGGCAGARLVPTDINGAPGFGQYRPDDDGHPPAIRAGPGADPGRPDRRQRDVPRQRGPVRRIRTPGDVPGGTTDEFRRPRSYTVATTHREGPDAP